MAKKSLSDTAFEILIGKIASSAIFNLATAINAAQDRTAAAAAFEQRMLRGYAIAKQAAFGVPVNPVPAKLKDLTADAAVLNDAIIGAVKDNLGDGLMKDGDETGRDFADRTQRLMKNLQAASDEALKLLPPQ